jgi:hypothetical protein
VVGPTDAGVSFPWALVVSNHRPPPCKSEAKVLVRGLSRSDRVPLPLSTFEYPRVVMQVLCREFGTAPSSVILVGALGVEPSTSAL